MSQPSASQGTNPTVVGGGKAAGPRVYRIVILGDGGVGKSGMVLFLMFLIYIGSVCQADSGSALLSSMR